MKNFSKSQFVRAQQCMKSLWLYRHRKDLKTEFSQFQQGLADSGTEFGILARQRFPGGTLITADHNHPEEALAQTAAAIAAGARVLYEAAFLHDDVLVRVDILVQEADGWALVEVKSGTDVEDVHLNDVAIQRYVLEGSGFPVKKFTVMHANSGYVRRGALDLHQLFKIMDVTVASHDALLEIPAHLATMKAQDAWPDAPAKAIGSHCTKPYECDFKAHCWAHVPEYSVFNLAYAKMPQKLQMFNSGVQRVDQINPGMHKLTAGQTAQVNAARAGRALIDMNAIKAFLATLKYPLAHLDFETDNPVVPPYDGLSPYAQMPFQAVLCVQDEPGAPVVEHGFLGDGLSDPRRPLINFLLDHTPKTGSILAYHKSFEAGRLEELADMVGNSTPVLLGMVKRLADLADPFRTNAYVHPGFKGRWSIKAVLPVLVPHMTYEGLEIGDGAAAMAAYGRMRLPGLPVAERERLKRALMAYCGQDVVAMVKILEHLYDLVAGKAPAGAA